MQTPSRRRKRIALSQYRPTEPHAAAAAAATNEPDAKVDSHHSPDVDAAIAAVTITFVNTDYVLMGDAATRTAHQLKSIVSKTAKLWAKAIFYLKSLYNQKSRVD